jgi:putative colanic acid biosynthesis acetyltransferase WcaB
MFYRFANVASRQRKRSWITWPWAIPYLLFYRFLTEWIIGIDLPASTTIGKGLIIDHGYALVINKNTVIGDYCRVRHCTTIGCKLNSDESQGPSPRIGSHVEIGSNCVIIGDITIGDHAVVGAGSVVVKDVPSRAVVAGNPAHVIRILTQP